MNDENKSALIGFAFIIARIIGIVLLFAFCLIFWPGFAFFFGSKDE